LSITSQSIKPPFSLSEESQTEQLVHYTSRRIEGEPSGQPGTVEATEEIQVAHAVLVGAEVHELRHYDAERQASSRLVGK
jgi:hypothetical protein